ncbi:MAG: AlwI family type II restriction endonuclease, partial [Bacteroidales bacterium]|nr:AlwI family type II restriction endonuclease [Bacteroidales bacterium]
GIFQKRIAKGETKTRESMDRSLAKFLRTQASNMRDYADACFRYLRATGLVAVSHVGKSLSIVPERVADVDYILRTVPRDTVVFASEAEYATYLGEATTPKLLTDDKRQLVKKIQTEFPDVDIPAKAGVLELKDLLANLLERRKEETLTAQVAEIKDYRLYDDIQKTYEQISNNELYDNPLMLEWNTWRAMTMLDGGVIKANLNFDDYGKPLSTAAGNMADIVCDYGDYIVCVEVTMSTGQRQYETEGEPVTRHLGKLKTSTGKPCYCLFVAPTINDACISHFYTLHHLNLAMYGGKSTIIPLPLNVFQKMVEDSYKVEYTPSAKQVRAFFEASNVFAKNADDEMMWYKQIIDKALHWLEK